MVTDFQIDFFNDSQLFPIFEGLTRIEQAKGFNLRHMTTLGPIEIQKYYVITKKLRQKSKIYDRKKVFF